MVQSYQSASHDLDDQLYEDASPETDGLQAHITYHLNSYFRAHNQQLPPQGLYARMLEVLEKPLLAETLKATQGNQLKAARVLGINRNTLRKKIHQWQLENYCRGKGE